MLQRNVLRIMAGEVCVRAAPMWPVDKGAAPLRDQA